MSDENLAKSVGVDCDACIDEIDVEKFVEKVEGADNTYRVKGIKGFCARKQKDGTCRAFEKFKEWVKGAKKKGMGLCVRCLQSGDAEISPDWMSACYEGGGEKNCPLKAKDFESVAAKDDDCRLKLVKAMEED